MDREVALKIVNLPDEGTKRRFDRERRAMGRLSQHSGVVTIYESGYTTDGLPYLMMPFIEGGSVQDRLDESGPFPWLEAVEIGARSTPTHLHGITSAEDDGLARRLFIEVGELT